MKASFYTLSLAALLLVSACSEKKDPETAAAPTTTSAPAEGVLTLTPQQMQNAGIELGGASQQQLGSTLQLSGEIDVPPTSMVSVSVPYGGFVKTLNLLPGQHVNKGQVLATLQHQDYVQLQQDYLDARARLQLANLELQRQQELTQEKVGALKNLQQIRTEREVLLNSLAALKEKLLMININPARLQNGKINRTISVLSPINGFVKNTMANVGKMVNPSDVLFELVNTDDLHLKLNAFEKDVPYLQKGQSLTYTLANDPTPRTAKILLVGHSVEGDKTIPVHAHLAHANEHELLPGMYVTATIQTKARTVTSLPESALVQFEGASYIFVGNPNHQFKRIEVTTGLKGNGFVEVALPAELQTSTQIAVKGAHNLLAMQENAGEEE
ncbi:efflux RND transporter periplasmic adaptor subunit [Rufibacter glacialis]|uniref:Efflux RND transporter periplasmic adaptor subunit n=1 Tax=Rufibacter glacialis TaxID=1259555 RepID=A0A5M8Q5K1_9BACT|nr:efflux RND transporter periplasmic adaptor subunit [Rufibacter glacialis]KAA6431165.1 efflux RND transporter periplasmic adaptor subunit [Rufibacter glacialis]GGK84637.1 hemolysin D [Rufibacter glacialis]